MENSIMTFALFFVLVLLGCNFSPIHGFGFSSSAFHMSSLSSSSLRLPLRLLATETMTTTATAQEEDVSSSSASSQQQQRAQEYPTPASYENKIFTCDPSVTFWREYNIDNTMTETDFLQTISSVAQKFTSRGGEALNYWLRHNVRTGYFFSNAVLGISASRISFLLNSVEEPENGFTKVLAQPQVIVRLLAEAALCFDQDWEQIADEKYNVPYDMYTWNKQYNPFFVVDQTGRYIQEAVGTLTRRNMSRQQDKDIWLTNTKSDLYPDYYKTAFHYQTDGWMSSDSANVYETSTETLFLGRQDAMQRTALIPLVEYANKNKGTLGRPLRILEIGCGTGRFLTFARDNLPLDTEFTAVDLSPFYLEKTRENDEQWMSIRKRMISNNNDENMNNIHTIKPVRVVQANGEKLPFGDEDFDVVICMYMFHEIPRYARANVSAEMARVVKSQGGTVIFTDSVQIGDRPNQDKTLGNFQDMNEPFYKDYIQDYLPLHFENAGLQPMQKTMSSNTKTLVFTKA
jgi:ubiquinone/menaquinone biosynthesis C-methylase UbiE